MNAALSLTNIYPGFSPGNEVHKLFWSLDFEWIKDVICCTKQAGWMAKSKVVSDYKLEHTNKELDGRLTSLLLLARFFSSALMFACCFVTLCTFPTFSSTPLLALLLLPLDVFALTHFHTPLPHMPPWYSYKTKPWLPPCLYFACG
jgi:hypothetical protein